MTIRKLGLLALSLAMLATPAMAQTVDLYHDKGNWNDAYKTVLDPAKEAIGVTVTPVPYADTSTYQAAVRAALRTPSAPGVFAWWSGYRMKDLVDAKLADRCQRGLEEIHRCRRWSARRLPRPSPSTARSTASEPSSPTGWCSTTRRSSPRTASPCRRPGPISRRPPRR